ncbi:hypothetical protein MC885_018132 [Smutsia gigantea]|nr:hypothetical protein MC885_018132 [Smutsia gigantea]
MATPEGGLLGPLPGPGALSPAQVEQLRTLKIQTRIANEKYLRAHREVDSLLSGFLREMFLKRPDNIKEFAAGSSGSKRALLPSGWVSKLPWAVSTTAKAYKDSH